MQVERTANRRRQPPPSYNHRVQTLGQRSNRHTLIPSTHFMPAASPSITAGGDPTPYRRGFLQSASRRIPAPPPPPFSGRQSRLPNHPFQLYTTLANINNTQSTQRPRTGSSRRNVSSQSSRSHSSTGGGVNVQSSSSSGSSSTISPPTAARRKRLLSISSDESVEEDSRFYQH